MLIHLAPELRYRQARQKARMIGQRQYQQLMAGKREDMECWGDLERKFIIDEIRRAFEAGRASVVSPAHSEAKTP